MGFTPPQFMRTDSNQAAFSLCEVALALGIFAFAMVAILGLMPVALDSARSSLDRATAVEVANGLAARLSRVSFSALSTMPSDYFYDDLGKESGDNASAIYFARITQADSISGNLKRVKITVTHGPNPANARSFCYLIFDQGT